MFFSKIMSIVLIIVSLKIDIKHSTISTRTLKILWSTLKNMSELFIAWPALIIFILLIYLGQISWIPTFILFFPIMVHPGYLLYISFCHKWFLFEFISQVIQLAGPRGRIPIWNFLAFRQKLENMFCLLVFLLLFWYNVYQLMYI